MTMCFSLVIATTFVLTLFGLVPYLRRCISGQGVQGPALKDARPLIYRAQCMGPIQKVLIQKLLLSLN